jgi:large subunit ribosomal protein L23
VCPPHPTALHVPHPQAGPRSTNLPLPSPNFTLTLLRTPFLPPTYASFIVPLNLNKLDIKDYLYNAYGIHVLSVRSFVQQQRVRQDKPNAKRPAYRRWFRPRAIKKMTVEMDKPFVWPEEPDDYSA